MVDPMVAGVTSALAIPGVSTGFGNTTPAGAEGSGEGVGFELELAAVRPSDAADDTGDGGVGAFETAQIIRPIPSASAASIASRLLVVLSRIPQGRASGAPPQPNQHKTPWSRRQESNPWPLASPETNR